MQVLWLAVDHCYVIGRGGDCASFEHYLLRSLSPCSACRMGYQNASWRQYVMRRLVFPWRHKKTEGSTLVRCSTGPFPAHQYVVRGEQERIAGSPSVDIIGSCVPSSGSTHCDEPGSRKYDRFGQQQSWKDLSRAVLSFANLGHQQVFQGPSRFARCIYTSPIAGQSFTAHVDGSLPSGIYESSRTAEQTVVNDINEILSHEGWERALEQLNVHLCTQLVIEVLRRQRNVNAALAFFQWAKRQGFLHTGRTYKAMLQKLSLHQDFKSRNLETFRLIMNESLRNGWSPGVTLHTWLIDGYCKLGRVHEAFRHFHEMLKHGCAPNVITYSSLIGGFIRVGKIDVALGLLDEMEELKCSPNVVTYSILIHGLVKHHQLGEAWKIFNRMKVEGCTPNLITYSCLVDGVAKEGKFEEVSKLLDHMRETRCIPNVFIYGTIIHYFVKAGKLQQAWELFNEMKQNGLVPNLFVYTPLMNSLGKAGDLEQAQELLTEMNLRRCAPDAVAYSALIAGLVQAGKWKEGLQVLDQMAASGCQPNEVAYTVLIDGLVRAREADLAQDLFKRMVANGCPVTIYTENALGKALARLRAQEERFAVGSELPLH